MPKITAFMRTSDPGRISTVVASPLTQPLEEQCRKKIEWFPNRGHKGAARTLVTEECREHPTGIATLPVVLMASDPGPPRKWKELGIARVCPLCWLVVIAPEGIDLPKPKPVLVEMPRRLRNPAVEKPKASRPRGVSVATLKAIFKIRQQMALVDTFTSHDVMEWLGTTRTAGLPYLKMLLAGNELEIVSQGGGPGNRTIYRKKVLKKDIETPQKQKDKGVDDENTNDVRFW